MKVFLERKNEKVHFEAVNESGQKVQMDGSEKAGGENLGARPMEMLLMGLGGCSGIDITLILDKMKQKASDVSIEIEGVRDPEKVPSLFEEIKVLFKIEGVDLDSKKVQKAVDLSMEKYCSVAMILGKSSPIHYEIQLNGSKL